MWNYSLHVERCKNINSINYLKARDVMKAIREYANIENDQISEDGLFTISEVECLGACVNAPMMQVNNEWFYEVLIIILKFLGFNS